MVPLDVIFTSSGILFPVAAAYLESSISQAIQSIRHSVSEPNTGFKSSSILLSRRPFYWQMTSQANCLQVSKPFASFDKAISKGSPSRQPINAAYKNFDMVSKSTVMFTMTCSTFSACSSANCYLMSMLQSQLDIFTCQRRQSSASPGYAPGFSSNLASPHR